MDIFGILQIFATVTGVMYLIMQIMQDKYMWYVYIPSCAALAAVMCHQKAWAFFVLNVYFVLMGCRGMWTWQRDLGSSTGKESKPIYVNPLPKWKALTSVGILAVCIPLLGWALSKSGDPYPWLDAVGSGISVVAVWWLTGAHRQHWLAWIVADIFVLVMQVKLGNVYLVGMYVFYLLASSFGYWNWRKKGILLDGKS